MLRVENPIQLALALRRTLFPDCSGFLVSGSVAKGTYDEYSDIDAFVLYENIEAARRETIEYGGKSVDLQIHDLETLTYVLSSDAKLGSAIVAQMLLDSIELPTPSAIGSKARVLAKNILVAGPPLTDFSGSRYVISNMLSDLERPMPKHELLATGVELYRVLTTFHLRHSRQWLASKKSLPSVLRASDARIEPRILAAFEELFSSGCVRSVIELCDELLKPVGGRLNNGFIIKYSPSQRLAAAKRPE